jgi:type IV secretion system protein VirB8
MSAVTNQKDYLEAAKAWETDEITRSKRSESRAWIVASVAVVVALLAVVAVVLLTPLKTVEPFVVKVDRNTGQSDVVTILDQKTVTYDEAVDKYFLGRYVNYREEFSDATAFPNYEAVSVMSSPNIGTAYFDTINPQNKLAPVNVYGKTGQVDVTVNSVSFIGKGVAQVRFTRRERMRGDIPWTETNWLATVSYTYVNPPIDEKGRLVNPVGFRVNDYRLDAETAR